MARPKAGYEMPGLHQGAMRLHAGAPFWPIRDGLPHSFPPLDEDAECDVLVVGAGITGALAAHELARRGHDVIVLDGRDAASGSTAASTAMVVHEVDPEHAGLAKALGPAGADETYRLMAEAVQEVAALSERVGAGDFARRPSLYLASRAAHVPRLRREFQARRRLGMDVDWVGQGELRRDYGCKRVAAIRTRGQGHMDPYGFTLGVLASGHKGVRVHDRTLVRRITYGSRVTAQTERGVSVQAGHVVFATGYETQLHATSFPKRLYTTYAVASEPGVQLWDDHAMFWETDRPYLYGRCTDEGRIVIGGYNDAYRAKRGAAATERRAADVVRGVRRLFPDLAFEPAYSWSGTFADTRDGLPYVGPDPKHRLAYFVLGFGANGTVFAQLGAKAVADAIEGKPRALPQRLRPKPS